MRMRRLIKNASQETMETIVGLARLLHSDLQRAVLNNGITPEGVDSLHSRAERLLRAAVVLVDTLPGMEENVRLIQGVVMSLSSVSNSLGASLPGGYAAPLVFNGLRGRPRLHITEDMLRYFISNGFTVRQTAVLLQVSQSTVRRRMNEMGLSIQLNTPTLTTTPWIRL